MCTTNTTEAIVELLTKMVNAMEIQDKQIRKLEHNFNEMDKIIFGIGRNLVWKSDQQENNKN